MSSPEQHTPNQDRRSAQSESNCTIEEQDGSDPDFRRAMMFNTLASMNSLLPPDQKNREATETMLSLATEHSLAAYYRQQNEGSTGRDQLSTGHDQLSTGHDQPQSSTGALIEQTYKEYEESTRRDQLSTGHDQPQSSTGALIEQIVKEQKESTGRDQPQSNSALIERIVKEQKEQKESTGRGQPTKSIAERRDEVERERSRLRKRSQWRERDPSDLDNSL
jgi:hypothetical protein